MSRAKPFPARVAALVAVLSLLVAAAGAIRLLFPQWSGAFESPIWFSGDRPVRCRVVFFVIVLAVTESTESVPAPCAEHRGVQRNRVRGDASFCSLDT